MGYQNLKLFDENYTMVAPTFATVANEDNQFSLRDIKVQPKPGTKFEYKQFFGWQGGIKPDNFVVKFLNSEGMPTATYNWKYERKGTLDDYTDTACWVKWSGSEYVELTDSELDAKIDAGTGLWIAGGGHSLAPAGRVDKRDIHFTLSTENYTATGNGTPVELTLGQLTVTPKPGTKFEYKQFFGWQGGIKPDNFVVKFLNSEGTPTATYNWKYERKGTLEEYTDKACWVKWSGSAYVELTQEELDEIKVPAGQGLWVAGEGHTLNFPAPEL